MEGNESVNAHTALDVGLTLIKAIVAEKITFGNIKFKMANRVVSLQAANTAKVNNKEENINSNVIFQRIIVGMEGKVEELPNYFQYELALHPLSIFHNSLLRKTDKSKLYDYFMPLQETLKDCINVIYRGFLIHKVVWPKNETYDRIMNHYLQFVKFYKPNSYIIFVGYPENKEKSTKTEERQRRQSHFCMTINFELHMQATVSQENFFSNENNKKRFITKLIAKLQAAGYRTKQAYEDADLLIVQTAIDVTTEEKPAVIIAEDVDILVILSQLFPNDKKVYLFKPSKGDVGDKLYNSNNFIYPDLKHLLGFIHAFTGCDTTSAFYLQGKQKIIKLLHDDNDLLQKSLIYNSVDANKETIAEVGSKIIAAMYSRTLKKLNFN